MIQFNLLPQVKVEYIKTKRLKRIMIVGSVAFTVVSVGLVIITASLAAVQNRHIANLDKDIDRISNEINDIPDIKKILSVQNQLNTLPSLYAGRPAVKRLPSYLDQTTPTGTINLSKVNVDFSTSKIEVAGTGESLEAVNRYVDTLKFTNYKVNDPSETKPAFTGVVLTNFGRDDLTASFTITFNFDAVIFDGAKEVQLEIPSIVTTRSQSASQSSDLFNGSLPAEGEQQ